MNEFGPFTRYDEEHQDRFPAREVKPKSICELSTHAMGTDARY